MVAGYAGGTFLCLASGAKTYFPEPSFTIGLYPIYPHFMISVAISGFFSPQMYIHLLEARDKNMLTPSLTSLPSLHVASALYSGVSPF